MIGPLKHLGVRGKVIFIVMVISFVGLVLGGLFSLFYNIENSRAHLRDQYLVLARIVASRSTAALTFQDVQVVEENIQNLREAPDFSGACVYGEEDKVFASYFRGKNVACPPIAGKGESFYFENNSLHIFSPILLDQEKIGTVYLQVKLMRLSESIFNYALIVISMIGVLTLLSYLMSLGLQRIVTHPITELARLANRVSDERNYGLRVSQESKDEVGRLALAFNQMLDTIHEQNQDLEASKAQLEQLVMQRTTELQRTNDELKSFSYSVSHDLRAPLRAINGFALALIEDAEDKLDDQERDYLTRIRNAGSRMGELIDSLLTLSRFTNKELSITQVDLTQLANECIAQLQDAEPTRQVDTTIEPNMTDSGDEILLRSVFENLISNAWKYTRHTEKAHIEIGRMQAEETATYFVRDNGVGFDMQYASKLFGAFQRLHNQQEFEGTGIGLATAMRIISRHGGKIWVEAEPNKGATFYFTLAVQA